MQPSIAANNLSAVFENHETYPDDLGQIRYKLKEEMDWEAPRVQYPAVGAIKFQTGHRGSQVWRNATKHQRHQRAQ